jgi:hypothetical protein
MDPIIRQSMYKMMTLYVKVDAMDAMHMMLQILDNEMPKDRRDMNLDLWHQQLETKWRCDAAEALWEHLWMDPILGDLDLVLGPRPTQFPCFKVKIDGKEAFSVTCSTGGGDDAKNPDVESRGSRHNQDDDYGDDGIRRHGPVCKSTFDKTIDHAMFEKMLAELRFTERTIRGDKSRQGPPPPPVEAKAADAAPKPLLKVSELSPLIRQAFETPSSGDTVEVDESDPYFVAGAAAAEAEILATETKQTDENPWMTALRGAKKMSEASSILRQAFGAATPQDEVDRINRLGGDIPWKVVQSKKKTKRGKSGK